MSDKIEYANKRLDISIILWFGFVFNKDIEFLKNNMIIKAANIVTTVSILPCIFVSQTPNFILNLSKNPNLFSKEIGKTIPLNPHIHFMTLSASSHSFARKKIQVKFMKLNVIIHASTFGRQKPKFFQIL